MATVADAKKAFPGHSVKPSPGSKKNQAYVAADGGIMPNRGEVTVTARTENGIEIPEMKFQDAPANMPILSVNCFTKKGSRFTVHDTGGHIRLPDKSKIPFYPINGVYVLKLMIDPPKGSGLPTFTGQGN